MGQDGYQEPGGTWDGVLPPPPPPGAVYGGGPFESPPPGAARYSNGPLIAAVVVCGALVIAVVVVGFVAGIGSGDDEMTARGRPIVNAAQGLARAEAGVEVFLREAGSRGHVAGADSVSCWFAYPDGGDDADTTLRCGPVVLADSEPGTHWLRVPVRYPREPGGDGVLMTTRMIDSARTVAVGPDEELRRPDGRAAPDTDEIDLERPSVPDADPGTMGVVPERSVMVDLDRPDTDARVVGMGYRWEMAGSATVDRARVDQGPGDAEVLAAPEGQRWLLFRSSTSLESDEALSPVQVSAAMIIDGERRPLEGDLSLDGLIRGDRLSDRDPVLAVLVPEDAERVALAIDDGVVEQRWSFTEQRRVGDAPEIFYRDPATRVAEIGQEHTLPYGIQDLHTVPAVPPVDLGDGTVLPGYPAIDNSRAFGEQEVTLEFGRARLVHAVSAGFEHLSDVRTPSGPGRAFLYLDSVVEESSNEMYWGDAQGALTGAVLVLEDGTEIESVRVAETPPVIRAGDPIGPDTPVAFAGHVWDVPAGLDRATVRLTFGQSEDMDYAYDFRNATIELPIDFPDPDSNSDPDSGD